MLKRCLPLVLLAVLFLFVGCGPATTTSAHAAAPKSIALVNTSAQQGVNGNPWGYNFTPAANHFIRNPPAAFCNGKYFRCIPNFWKGKGYVVECHDGLYGKSGGLSGSCSGHKGNWRILYWH